MRVRWTTDAADDLERIYDHIAETNSDAARRIASTVLDGIASLETFPHRGRPGRVAGMREFVFVPLPWIAVYEVDAEVRILRILHGSQRWPR